MLCISRYLPMLIADGMLPLLVSVVSCESASLESLQVGYWAGSIQLRSSGFVAAVCGGHPVRRSVLHFGNVRHLAFAVAHLSP